AIRTRPAGHVVNELAVSVSTLWRESARDGADHAKIGLIERAGGGVLFLDEISEMPLTAQAKLLRVLQRQFLRLGGTRAIDADVHIQMTRGRIDIIDVEALDGWSDLESTR